MKNPETHKEIEALKRIETTFSMNKQGKESAYREYTNSIYPYYEDFYLVLNALKRLEAIDNTNHSEALECVNELWQDINVENNFRNDFKHLETINNYILKAQEQENVLKELIFLINDLEPTFNRKGVSSDTDKLGTIAKDYFYDNASELLKRYFEDDKGI